MVRVGDWDESALLRGILEFCQDVGFHGSKIEHLATAYVQSKATHFALEFAPSGFIAIIFRPARDKFDNVVPLQLVGHLAQKISSRDLGLTRTLFINDTVRVVIEHLLL